MIDKIDENKFLTNFMAIMSNLLLVETSKNKNFDFENFNR